MSPASPCSSRQQEVYPAKTPSQSLPNSRWLWGTLGGNAARFVLTLGTPGMEAKSWGALRDYLAQRFPNTLEPWGESPSTSPIMEAQEPARGAPARGAVWNAGSRAPPQAPCHSPRDVGGSPAVVRAPVAPTPSRAVTYIWAQFTNAISRRTPIRDGEKRELRGLKRRLPGPLCPAPEASPRRGSQQHPRVVAARALLRRLHSLAELCPRHPPRGQLALIPGGPSDVQGRSLQASISLGPQLPEAPRRPQLVPKTSNMDISPLDKGGYCCLHVAPPVPQATNSHRDRRRGPL